MTMKNGKAARGTMEEIAKTSEPTALERRLLDDFQRDFPLEPLPFAEVAAQVGSDQATVIAALRRLTAEGHVSRVGAVVAPHAVGWSTLAAMAVPEARLETVAELVNGYSEVNHNYEREHRLNLWFVVAAEDEEAVAAVLRDISAISGLEVIDLPLIESFRIDLGFALRWA
jgi:DNA-binding Lrp family transcriptional regulator